MRVLVNRQTGFLFRIDRAGICTNNFGMDAIYMVSRQLQHLSLSRCLLSLCLLSLGKIVFPWFGNGRGMTSQRCLLSFLCISLMVLWCSGCSLLSKGPVAENVVTSRQLSLRGMEAMQQGNWELAETRFASAVEACPVDERARCRYAETLWQRGEVDEAIVQMNEAVRLSAGDPQLMVQLGEMYLSRGELSPADRLAERAIAANPQLASAWALKGNVLNRRDLPEQALARYHRALCFQAHYPQVQLAAAEIYRQKNRPQRALATLQLLAEQYLPGEEPAEVRYLEGLALKSLGRYENAVESFQMAMQRDKPNVELLYHLGEAQLLAGDVTNAHLTVSRALEMAPQHVASRQLQTHIASRQQRMASATGR